MIPVKSDSGFTDSVKERINLAMQAVSDAGVVGSIDADELVDIASQTDIPPEKFKELAGVIAYFRKRNIEGKSRIQAFKESFPHRVVPSGYDKYTPFPAGDKEEISDSAINIKAKRLEEKSIYKKVVTLLTSSIHVSYALDRYKVLDNVLEHILSPHTNNRDRAALAKVFLEETRKPANVSGVEVNVNLTNNQVNLADVDRKLDSIADALRNKPANEIIDVISGDKKNDS